MRRIRKVTIAVSDDYYRVLDEGRNRYKQRMLEKTGIDKPISIPQYTSILAQRSKLARITYHDVFGKKRRR